MASSICDRGPRARRPAPAAYLAALACAVVALPVRAARADAPPGAGPSARESAHAKLVEGVELLKRGDFGEALRRFEDAYAVVPSPNIHYDLGLAYLGLDRAPDALAAFDRFLAEAKDAPSDRREKAERHREGLRARVATVRLSSDVASADVTVDGRARGGAALGGALYLDAGHHRIAVSSPRAGTTRIAEVDVRAGQTLELTLRLLDAPEAGIGAPFARAPAPSAPSPTEDVGRSLRTWGIVAAAAGVALAGGGVVFGLLARREGDRVSAASLAYGTFDPGQEQRGTRDQTIEAVLIAAGATAALSGTVLFAVGRKHEAEKSRMTWTASVWAAPAGGGVRFSF
jgi:Tetratricopeptide repeat